MANKTSTSKKTVATFAVIGVVLLALGVVLCSVFGNNALLHTNRYDGYEFAFASEPAAVDGEQVDVVANLDYYHTQPGDTQLGNRAAKVITNSFLYKRFIVNEEYRLNSYSGLKFGRGLSDRNFTAIALQSELLPDNSSAVITRSFRTGNVLHLYFGTAPCSDDMSFKKAVEDYTETHLLVYVDAEQMEFVDSVEVVIAPLS